MAVSSTSVCFHPIKATITRREIFWKAVEFDILQGKYRLSVKGGQIISKYVTRWRLYSG
jgi:hypothetical protein